MVRTTEQKSPHYVVLSTPLSPHPSSAPYSRTSSAYFPPSVKVTKPQIHTKQQAKLRLMTLCSPMYGYFCPEDGGKKFHCNINNTVNPEGHSGNTKFLLHKKISQLMQVTSYLILRRMISDILLLNKKTYVSYAKQYAGLICIVGTAQLEEV